MRVNDIRFSIHEMDLAEWVKDPANKRPFIRNVLNEYMRASVKEGAKIKIWFGTAFCQLTLYLTSNVDWFHEIIFELVEDDNVVKSWSENGEFSMEELEEKILNGFNTGEILLRQTFSERIERKMQNSINLPIPDQYGEW